MSTSEQEAAGWAAYLAGVPLGLELPEDRPRAAERSFHEDRCPLTPGSALLEDVATLARNEQTVPAVVWLAALQALLHRYTSETDVLVGSPAPGAEPAEGAEPAVMPWRTRLDGELSFRALVGRVEAARRVHERLGPLSVEECAEFLHGAATPRDLPLFQVGFVWGEAVALGPAALAGWVANADLILLLAGEGRPASGPALGPAPGPARVELAFNRDRFEPATVERLARHLQTLIGSAMADPDRRLSELQLFSDAERHQILVEWNASSVDLPDRLFHQRVEEQTARTPAATAVVDRAERLTYERLNARANQLAHHLRALGAHEDTRVVVALERSAAYIVAVLAILKTGATAVLVDPVNPPSRLRFMLRDTEPVALVTREGLLERFAGPQRPAVVCVDRDRELLASRPTGNPPPAAVTQDSVSHVIYTSGSTGEPKGTMAPHRAITTFASWVPRAFSISSEDRSAWVSSPGFGVSLIEWPPLLAGGGTVYVAEQDVSASPERMRDWLVANSITFAALVNSLAVRVCALEWPPTAALRFMLTVGELVREWPPDDLPFEVVIAYGSTEGGLGTATYDEAAGVYATSKAFSAQQRALRRPPPVGRPTRSSRTYVLDRYGQPVPPGVPGELYIAADSMSLGYLNRPELTAEKFVANWLPEEPSATLCRTGDLARYGPDGLLQILGRIDSQVKIRGFRIELEEIETVLAAQPAVGQVAVVAREDVPGDSKLVAYVVPARQTGLSLRQLRQALQARLPYYMVPAAFVVLDELPSLPNGKLDRRSLPAPVMTRQALETEFVAPGDDTQRRLADIWSELLRVEEIGVDDSFFELGGHSLLAAELMSRLKDELKVELDVTEFADEPTIAELARRVQQARP